MNKYEIIFLFLAELLLLIYLRWQFKSWRIALPLATLSVIPLYLSLERASQFLTLDATGIILEPLHLASSDLGQWLRGAFRTTDTSLGLLAAILHHYFPGMTETQGKIMLKNLHWMSGFVLLFWIHHLLSRHLVSESNKKIFLLAFIYTAFLLPTNNLSLKIFTYDLLSMLLGILALLYFLVAVKERNTKDALIGIVTAFLAAQEKLSASPILFFSLAVYGYLVALKASRLRYVKLLQGVLLGFIVAVSTGAVCMLLVAGIRHWDVPAGFLESLADPFVSWAWVVMSFTLGITGLSNLRAYTVSLLALSFLTSCLLAIVLLLADRFFAKRSSWLMLTIRLVSRANIFLVILVFLLGAVSTYYVDLYWAPYFPVDPGNYHPTVGMNRAYWHFGAASLWQHIISFVAWSYSAFVNAVPSVYWLCFVGALIAARILRREQRTEVSVELLLTAGLLMPLVFGLGQIPVGNKYLNIGLFLIAIGIALKTTDSLTDLSAAKKAAFCVVSATLLIGEVLPFRPLYAPFRPVWSEYDDSTMPIAGKLNPSWQGWGEEVMLVGQLIEEQCRISSNNTLNGVPCDSITMYIECMGEWLDENTDITVFIVWYLPSTEEVSYTEADYYVVNRLNTAQAAVFPVEVEPAFVISFRGFIQAWVFRMDHLAEAGYEFINVGGFTRLGRQAFRQRLLAENK